MKKKHFQTGNDGLATLKLSKTQLRWLSLLPLTFFGAQAIHYWEINQLGHMLWMCNIGNLLLSIGLFLGEVILIRVAVIWMVPGVVVWALYVVPTWGMLLTGDASFGQFFGVLSSSLAHLGGFSVGMLALQKVRMDKRAWLYAVIWYFVVQLLSRLLTPAEMNVNLAHRIQDGWEQSLSSYWKFWLCLTLMVGLCLWILGFVLSILWPDLSRLQRNQVGPNSL
ncbi:MAG TPA: hypothetical protein VMS31_01200 [Pyrinomonadaceae bacterium]|nr:hypothetical protein [Pyrinomonadaceae bacterium]